jgi:DUF917 family protein
LKGGEEILATTPNLIVVVESDIGIALQTEELKFGIRVSILVIPGKKSPLRKSPQGWVISVMRNFQLGEKFL